MKTEHQFAAVLKKMMESMPLDEISVTTLSKKCEVSRKTFYYHFRDVYDLLTLVYLDEKITANLDSIRSNKGLLEVIFKYYSKNSKFIDATLESAGKDLFNEFIFNFCYQVIMTNFLSDDETIRLLNTNQRKNIARFYSFAYSNTISYYLSTHKTKSYEEMASCFSFLGDDAFQKAVKNYSGMEVNA